MIYFVIIFIIVLLFGGLLGLKYFKLKNEKKKLEVVEENIFDILDKKQKAIEEVLTDINDEKLTNDSSFLEIASVFEVEDCLFNIRFNLNKYLDKKKLLDKYKKELRNLNSIEDNLDGLKDFYNAIVLNYNELFLKKPFYFFYKALKFEQNKSFKVRKLDEYEILTKEQKN